MYVCREGVDTAESLYKEVQTTRTRLLSLSHAQHDQLHACLRLHQLNIEAQEVRLITP